jgi:hypothetical protein
MTEAGIWKIYSYTNMERDLAIHNSFYYFVQYQSQTIGILKLIENIPLAEFKNRKSAKLDRIYLDPEFQPRHRKNSSRLDRKRLAASGHSLL